MLPRSIPLTPPPGTLLHTPLGATIGTVLGTSLDSPLLMTLGALLVLLQVLLSSTPFPEGNSQESP